jgi:hypothetical protein
VPSGGLQLCIRKHIGEIRNKYHMPQLQCSRQLDILSFTCLRSQSGVERTSLGLLKTLAIAALASRKVTTRTKVT